MNAMDYERLIRTVYYHNNLDIEVIKELFNRRLLICSTEKFWNDNGRKINGNVEELSYPVFKYRYVDNKTNKPITYAEMSIVELREAVKTGLIRKEAILVDHRKIAVTELDNTVGKPFSLEPFNINLSSLMQVYETYDITELSFKLLNDAMVDKRIRLVVEEAIISILEGTRIIETPKEDIHSIIEQLAKVFNLIDLKVKRKKLIDLRRERLDELADNILCTIEARNIRKMLGGADV